MSHLTRQTKFFYGLGQIGDVGFNAIVASFVLLFYNQAIGLRADLGGFALLIATVSDAITDPAIGMLSDRWKSKRFGRRHPFMFAAALPLALAVIAIFSPPSISNGEGLVFAWLVIWLILGRIFQTMYCVPHLGLGAELTLDYDERATLFSYNAVMGALSGALVGYVAWTYFLSDNADQTSSALSQQQNYLHLGLVIAVLIFAGIFLCSLMTLGPARSRFHQINRPRKDSHKAAIYSEVWQVLSHKSYVWLMLGMVCFFVTSGMVEVSNSFVWAFFWGLNGKTIAWFSIVNLLAGIFAAIISPHLIARFDKKSVAVCAISVVAVSHPMPILLSLFGLLTNGDRLAVFLSLCIQSFFVTGGVTALSIAAYSMISDLIDLDELEYGRRRDALFFALRTLFSKFGQAVSFFLAGLALEFFVQISPGQVMETVTSGQVFRLGIFSGPLAIIGVLCAIFAYAQYDFSRTRHQDVRARLDVRNGVRVPAEGPGDTALHGPAADTPLSG